MSAQDAPAVEEAATATADEQQPQDPKPTETVDFWKQKSREWEKKAKDNSSAAKELETIRESQKTDEQKTADRIAALEADAATVPTKVADALRTHLVELHQIDADDAELFLTGTEPELLLKQVTRLISQPDKRKNHVPKEGASPKAADSEEADFVRNLFGD